jgi:hypothetical protein
MISIILKLKKMVTKVQVRKVPEPLIMAPPKQIWEDTGPDIAQSFLKSFEELSEEGRKLVCLCATAPTIVLRWNEHIVLITQYSEQKLNEYRGELYAEAGRASLEIGESLTYYDEVLVVTLKQGTFLVEQDPHR